MEQKHARYQVRSLSIKITRSVYATHKVIFQVGSHVSRDTMQLTWYIKRALKIKYIITVMCNLAACVIP